jgi:putative membrane protein insertion efficiency factor
VSKILSMFLVKVIRFYQLFVSPWLGKSCRHTPTCSAYSIKAISRFGLLKGGWLSAKRISKCHPWGTSGYDPVPGASIDDAF